MITFILIRKLKGKKAILIKGALLLLEKEKIDSDELKALIKEESPRTKA